VRGLRLDLRHELDRRGAGADHRDALAGEVVLVVPLRGVKGVALEAVQAREVGHVGLLQRAGRGDHALRHVTPVGGVDQPALTRVIPPRSEHLDTEANLRQHAELLGGALGVALELRLRGVHPRPVRVGRKRQRVQVGRDVAGAARVGVHSPGAAHTRFALEHDVVVDPLLHQPR